MWYKIHLIDPFGEEVIVKIPKTENMKQRLHEELRFLYADSVVRRFSRVWKEYSKKYNLPREISEEDFEIIIWNTDKPRYIKIKTNEMTCEGCYYDSPGQKSHMGEGGCLSYDSSTESNESLGDNYFPN